VKVDYIYRKAMYGGKCFKLKYMVTVPAMPLIYTRMIPLKQIIKRLKTLKGSGA